MSVAASRNSSFSSAAVVRTLSPAQKLKFEHLNLNIGVDDAPADPSVRSIQRHPRIVSLFWLEKLNLVIYFFQIHGLLWLLAADFPWPSQ